MLVRYVKGVRAERSAEEGSRSGPSDLRVLQIRHSMCRVGTASSVSFTDSSHPYGVTVAVLGPERIPHRARLCGLRGPSTRAGIGSGSSRQSVTGGAGWSGVARHRSTSSATTPAALCSPKAWVGLAAPAVPNRTSRGTCPPQTRPRRSPPCPGRSSRRRIDDPVGSGLLDAEPSGELVHRQIVRQYVTTGAPGLGTAVPRADPGGPHRRPRAAVRSCGHAVTGLPELARAQPGEQGYPGVKPFL
jgi:hypothetical protein